VFAALALTVLISFARPVPASAASFITGEWGTFKGVSTFWGNLSVGGKYGLCVDPGAHPPTKLDNTAADKKCGKYDSKGVPDKTAQLAYLLGAYLHDGSDKRLRSISEFARKQYHDDVGVRYDDVYDDLVAEAKENGGPKQAYAEVDLENSKVWIGLVRDGEADKITNPLEPFTRDDAHFVDGYTATVKITSGNATFSDGTLECVPTLAVEFGIRFSLGIGFNHSTASINAPYNSRCCNVSSYHVAQPHVGSSTHNLRYRNGPPVAGYARKSSPSPGSLSR
jgi:hypothetical protein